MYLFSSAIRISEGLKPKFELTTVNELSVFESLRFYCIWFLSDLCMEGF